MALAVLLCDEVSLAGFNLTSTIENLVCDPSQIGLHSHEQCTAITTPETSAARHRVPHQYYDHFEYGMKGTGGKGMNSLETTGMPHNLTQETLFIQSLESAGIIQRMVPDR